MNFDDLDDDVDVQLYVQDLLNIQQTTSIDQSASQLDRVLRLIDELQNKSEVKKQKVQKELETALKISELNIDNKRRECEELRNELENFKQILK
ncbi:hypothetical protein pb186bvf_010849 [Paramecium bursaria]